MDLCRRRFHDQPAIEAAAALDVHRHVLGPSISPPAIRDAHGPPSPPPTSQVRSLFSSASRSPFPEATPVWAYTSSSYGAVGLQYSTPMAVGNGGSSAASSCASGRLVSSWTSTSGAEAATTSGASVPGFSRSPFSLSLPNTSGLPCSTSTCASAATSLPVMWSKTASLKTTQFCRISTNDAPRCAWARFSTPIRCGCSVSIERATNRAPAPSAKAHADTGFSTDPNGVEGERVPRRDVGEYWPLVRP